MSSEYDSMLIVCQHILNLLVEGPGGDVHSFGGKVVQALLPGPNAANTPYTGHVESKITRAWGQIAVDIASAKSGVCFSNDCFQGMRHSKDITIGRFDWVVAAEDTSVEVGIERSYEKRRRKRLLHKI
jgi:hypothetical protein